MYPSGQVNALLKAASESGPLKGFLGFEERPLVSTDFVNDNRSSIVDAECTMVVQVRRCMVWQPFCSAKNRHSGSCPLFLRGEAVRATRVGLTKACFKENEISCQGFRSNVATHSHYYFAWVIKTKLVQGPAPRFVPRFMTLLLRLTQCRHDCNRGNW